MHWLRPLRRTLGRAKSATVPRRPLRTVLRLESLDGRIVPATLSGNAWPNSQLVTISFVPDGTVIANNGATPVGSNLFATLNARFGSPAVWQPIVLRAAQSWAAATNLNFAVVADDGANMGHGEYQQGSPLHGDIRIGGYNFGNSNLATAYMPPPVNNQDLAGEIKFNTALPFNSGTTYDLYTVASHEFGHSLGLYHSNIASAALFGAYAGVKNSLTSDDLGGIRAIYSAGLPRSADVFDLALSNNTAAAATDLTSSVDPTTNTAVVTGLDITTAADTDWYMIGGSVATTTNTLTVAAQSTGLSLLAPTLTVYAADKTTVLGTATAGANGYGSTVSLTVSGVGAGSPVYIRVGGAAGGFSTGAYALTLNTGTGPNPVADPPDTDRLNSLFPSLGGGTPERVAGETMANTYTAGTQEFTSGSGAREIAMDAAGNFAVVWTSDGQDGDRGGVYMQRYNADGTKSGGEVRVNTRTTGDQTDPTVAMTANGYVVVTWASRDQDGGGWGVYGQVFAPDGSRPGAEYRINTTTSGDQLAPSSAFDANGNITYVWQSNGQDGDKHGIYLQKYNAYGVKVGGEVRVNTTTAGDQKAPQVAVAADGSAVVTWVSVGQDGDKGGVYAQRFNADGSKAGTEFRVNTTTKDEQVSPSVGIAPDGRFTIAWASNNQDGGGYGVYAQRFNAAGTKAGAEFRVNTYTADAQQSPQVAVDAVGTVTVVWSSKDQNGTGTGWTARGQQYLSTGEAVGGEFQVTTTATLTQQSPAIAWDGTGHMVVGWSGSNGTAGDGVYFQRYDLLSNDLGEASDTFDPFGETPELRAALIAYLTENGIDLYGYGVGRIAPAEPSAAPAATAAVAGPAALTFAPAATVAVTAPAAVPAPAGGREAVGFAQWTNGAGVAFQAAAVVPAGVGPVSTATTPSTTAASAPEIDFHYEGWYYAEASETDADTLDAAWDESGDMIVTAAGEETDAGEEWANHAPVNVD